MVVAKQLRASGGIWARLGDLNLMIDPGPGSLVRALASRPKLDPATLDAVILTHRHLDHSADANIIIDAMTNGGWRERGRLFAPADALDEEPVVYSYLRKAMQVEVLHQGGRYDLNGVSFSAPLRMKHGVETYGLKFDLPLGTLALIPDTEFFPEISDAYRLPRGSRAGADFLIINLLRYDPHESGEVQHLCLADAEQLIREIKPRLAVITHFGMTMLKAKPWEVAERLSEQTGVKVLAARDGMTLNLLDPSTM